MGTSEVAFVSVMPKAREVKLAHALRSQGVKVHLLNVGKSAYTTRLEDYFESIHETSRLSNALKWLRNPSFDMIHVFFSAAEAELYELVRDLGRPFILDFNDVWSPCYFESNPERYQVVQKLLNLASASCERDLQLSRASQLDGLPLPQKRLSFPEYCWNTEVDVSSQGVQDCERTKSKDQLRVVSVGMFLPERSGWRDSGLLQTAQLLADRQIELHIYPHWTYAGLFDQRSEGLFSANDHIGQVFSDYLHLQEVVPSLRLHKPVPPEQLTSHLRRFDAGLIVAGSSLAGQRAEYYKPEYLKSCFSGRISDYIDAGLPVISNWEMDFNMRLLTDLQVDIDFEGVVAPGGEQFLRGRLQEIHEKAAVENAVRGFSLAENARKLTDFYDMTFTN